MRPLRSFADLAGVTDDPLLLWSGQGLDDGSAVAWSSGGSIGVAAQGLAGRDRLAVAGEVETVAAMTERILSRTGIAYRPLGDRHLVSGVCRLLPELEAVPPFGWMTTTGSVELPDPSEQARPEDGPEIEALLAADFPDSLARPGMADARQWWVERQDGRVVACAADAFSGGGIGMLAGVAVGSKARGRGLARKVVGTALGDLLSRFPRVALMVDDDNAPARGLYESLGMKHAPVLAAAPSRSGTPT
jgi:ribosomal protein S18 acetylase RimI-like enzyme